MLAREQVSLHQSRIERVGVGLHVERDSTLEGTSSQVTLSLALVDLPAQQDRVSPSEQTEEKGLTEATPERKPRRSDREVLPPSSGKEKERQRRAWRALQVLRGKQFVTFLAPGRSLAPSKNFVLPCTTGVGEA